MVSLKATTKQTKKRRIKPLFATAKEQPDALEARVMFLSNVRRRFRIPTDRIGTWTHSRRPRPKQTFVHAQLHSYRR